MAELRAGRAERAPLFASVGAALKREIAAGRFAQADLLPGERELSEMLDVSRTTLRRAIAALVDEGVLVHRHGAGHIRQAQSPACRAAAVAPDEFHRGHAVARPGRLVQGDRARNLPADARRIDDARHRADRTRLPSRTAEARRRRADGDRTRRGSAPLSWRRRAGRGLALCRPRGGGFPTGAGDRAAARRRGRRSEAALLGVAEGAPALDIHRVAYAADGRRVEFTRSTYRSDTYDFVAELTLLPGARTRAEGAAR